MMMIMEFDGWNMINYLENSWNQSYWIELLRKTQKIWRPLFSLKPIVDDRFPILDPLRAVRQPRCCWWHRWHPSIFHDEIRTVNPEERKWAMKISSIGWLGNSRKVAPWPAPHWNPWFIGNLCWDFLETPGRSLRIYRSLSHWIGIGNHSLEAPNLLSLALLLLASVLGAASRLWPTLGSPKNP